MTEINVLHYLKCQTLSQLWHHVMADVITTFRVSQWQLDYKQSRSNLKVKMDEKASQTPAWDNNE